MISAMGVRRSPRIKRQWYDYSNYYGYQYSQPYTYQYRQPYTYQYRQPFTLSYFRGQPVYPSNYGIHTQPNNYAYNYNYYQRQPVYYSNNDYAVYQRGDVNEGTNLLIESWQPSDRGIQMVVTFGKKNWEEEVQLDQYTESFQDSPLKSLRNSG
ncbi:hypothetical protein NECAME_01744 [Necator americanus]|uniref:Uncharacterized protein n=1 Tax=Necator americanus TaxID=51031 RepID=W2TQY1_NECAM|nr:hypothetical protein NECAME_01744 [Necator americanus]ETN83437.1 hypothetical protein NECAME_01744 [Necator americanus]